MASTINAKSSGAGGLDYTGDSSGILGLQTGGVTAVTIDTSQRIGVGTTSPEYKLDVSGTARLGNGVSQGSPNSTNILSTAHTMLSGYGGNYLSIGQYDSGSGFAQWIQSSYTNPTTATYNLVLNPLGGNIGIGTASPSAKLQANSTYATTWNTNDSTAAGYTPQANELAIINNQNATTNSWAGIFFQGGQASTNTQLHTARIACVNDGTTYGGALAFATRDASTANSVERMRIDSIGNLLINKTALPAAISTATNILYIENGTGDGQIILNNTRGLGSQYMEQFWRQSTLVGSIQATLSATSYLTSSDYRLKENITPIVGALDKVAQLNPVNWTWKVDGTDGQGFIAHELQEVVPDCVTGEKDAVKEDGTPEYQGVDTSFLVATLTAAIKEQQTIINDLKARIETLEAK